MYLFFSIINLKLNKNIYFKASLTPLKSLWIFLVCDFGGAVFGTLGYKFLTNILLTKNHVLYEIE
jgi:hypothetical protein